MNRLPVRPVRFNFRNPQYITEYHCDMFDALLDLYPDLARLITYGDRDCIWGLLCNTAFDDGLLNPEEAIELSDAAHDGNMVLRPNNWA